MVTQLTISIL